MAGNAAAHPVAQAQSPGSLGTAPNASTVANASSESDASSPTSNTSATTVGAETTDLQSTNQGALSGAETQARGPVVYYVIMESYSVQFSAGAPDPEDMAQTRQYGQYEPRTLEELQTMTWNLLLPIDAAETADQSCKYPVMELPKEIRLHIWEFVIADNTVDLIDFCHNPECDYVDKTDHPWYRGRCFFTHFSHQRSGVSEDYHKPLVTPGLNLLLISKTVRDEVLPLLHKGRHFNIQTASLECASKIVLACPYVKTVAFPIPAFWSVLSRLSFAGKPGVQWWARHMARYLSEFPGNSISKVIFWRDEARRSTFSGHDEGMIYHRMELNDPEPGKERWNIRFTGSL